MKILFRIFRIITCGFLKPSLRGIWTLFLALLLLIAIDFLLTSRHQLSPGESAIIREVWHRKKDLIGPVAYPFRIRSVENKTDRVLNFFIQPFPFGVVEEVLKTAELRGFNGKLPLWTKDTITGKSLDRDIARVCVFNGKFHISQLDVYARTLDHEAATYATGGRITYRSREETLADKLQDNFEEYLTNTVNDIGSDLRLKYLYLIQIFQPLQKLDPAFKREFFFNNPWLIFDFKLRIQDFEAVRGIATANPEVFQKLRELQVQAEEEGQLPLLAPKLAEEINSFLSEYLRKNPQIYEKERWEHALNYAIREEIKSSFELQKYIHTFVERNFTSLEKEYQETIQKNTFALQLGIEITKLNFEIVNEPAANYPSLPIFH